MHDFRYYVPTKVFFGKNSLENLGGTLSKEGNRVLFVYDSFIKETLIYKIIIDELNKYNLEYVEFTGIKPNPSIELVRQGGLVAKKEEVDMVLVAGGGSAMDAGKWIAVAAKSHEDPWKYFSQNLSVEDALPIFTIPTAAATGSEMDSCGVISNEESFEKLARESDFIFPKASFINPEFTYSCSSYQTACGTADIMSHLMEVYFSLDEDLEMLDRFMEGAMKTVIKYGPIALNNPKDYHARAELSYAASWAINGFTNGGKQTAWSCHVMEHEFSAFYNITHGLGLAILQPRWMRYCLNDRTLDKYVSFATNVFDIDRNFSKEEIALKGIEALEDFLYNKLGLTSSLGQLGIDDKNFEVMAKKAVAEKGGLIKGFIDLKEEDLVNIFKLCL